MCNACWRLLRGATRRTEIQFSADFHPPLAFPSFQGRHDGQTSCLIAVYRNVPRSRHPIDAYAFAGVLPRGSSVYGLPSHLSERYLDSDHQTGRRIPNAT